MSSADDVETTEPPPAGAGAAASPGASWRRRHGLALALLALALAPHLPALSAEFTYDDQEFVEHNAQIRSLSAALGAFSSPFPPEQPERGLYRPLTALSYALDHALFGLNPRAFHATNLLYYFLTVVLVYLLALRLLGSFPLALALGLLFALHPAHCEAVDSVTGRSEVLGLLFALATLHAFVRFYSPEPSEGARGRWLAFALALLAAMAAPLSKESGLMVHGALALVVLTTPTARSWRDRLLTLAPFALAGVAYLLIRRAALGGALVPAVTVLADADATTRLLTAARVYGEYARLLVAPTELQVDVYYQQLIGTPRGFSVAQLPGFALLLFSLGGLALLLWRGRSPRARVAALGLGWYLLFLFPVLHLLPVGVLMAERLLFAPSFGALLLLAAIAPKLDRTRTRRVGLGLLCVLCALFAVRSYARAAEWRDSVTLWTSALQQVEGDYRVYNNLAMGYLARRDLDRAATLFNHSLKLRYHPMTVNNLATVLIQARQLARAEALLRELLRRGHRDELTWNHLGVIHERRGERAEALRCYQRALAHNPNNALIRRNIARLRSRPAAP